MPQTIHLTSTHSTNSYLRNFVETTRCDEEGTLVWSDYQTAGRGQKNNKWESEAEKNLLFTLLMQPKMIPASEQFIISQIVSVAICDVLEQYGEGFAIKWPNDIYYKDSKVAGILIENDLSGHVLYNSYIGVGLNVNQQQFFSDAPNPISLYQILGEETERESLLKQIKDYMMSLYHFVVEGGEEAVKARYMDLLYRGCGFYPYRKNGVVFEAQIKRISPLGHITLEDKNGVEETFDFKEVEHVI